MNMEIKLIEGFMVLSLFLGYLALWRFKKRKMLRHNGDDPEVIYDDNRPSQKFFANLSRLMSVFIALLIVLHGAGVKDNFGFYPIEFLDNETINIIGFVLGLTGLLLCWRAQQEMGNSWPVGIDRQKKTALVTTGVFKKVRNPTYSGLFLICAGSFLIFPTISFMAWVIVFYLSIEFQVRIEEEFLTDTHGEYYLNYYKNTKRYIPFLY
jgi:protein-S-isoprenylcysteine O-methyltransferase Ste14